MPRARPGQRASIKLSGKSEARAASYRRRSFSEPPTGSYGWKRDHGPPIPVSGKRGSSSGEEGPVVWENKSTSALDTFHPLPRPTLGRKAGLEGARYGVRL